MRRCTCSKTLKFCYMRTYLLGGIICLACSSFSANSDLCAGAHRSKIGKLALKQNVFELTVHRLSGNRVIISWHCENETAQSRFEVMRKHGTEIYSSLGIVEPRLAENNSSDFSFVDINTFEDSSFYCVKKTDPGGVVFFSLSRGVEGVGSER